MSYGMNELVEVNGRRGIVVSEMYTKLFYTQHDREMMSLMRDYEGGTAQCCVNVLFPETGDTQSIWVAKIKRVSK